MHAVLIFFSVLFSQLFVAVASPLPLPLALMAPDYESRRIEAHNLSRSSIPEVSTVYSSKFPSHRIRAPVEYTMRRDYDVLSILLGYRNSAYQHSVNLGRLAGKSASVQDDLDDFQRETTTELSAYDTSLLGIRSTLDALGADKGLANYDKTNQLETALKDIINAHKDALSAVSVMVYNIPGLGPILGPTVYEIKCIVDDILNAVENLTDEVINDLGPLLRGLLGRAEP